jgi:hypothetical protein
MNTGSTGQNMRQRPRSFGHRRRYPAGEERLHLQDAKLAIQDCIEPEESVLHVRL